MMTCCSGGMNFNRRLGMENKRKGRLKQVGVVEIIGGWLEAAERERQRGNESRTGCSESPSKTSLASK